MNSPPEPIATRTLAVSGLDDTLRSAMFALLDRHFEGVTTVQFDADLAAKSHAILLERGDRLVGFTTLLAWRAEFVGEKIGAIYSGDTIVAPEAWNSPALSRAWIGTVNWLRREELPGRCFWLLITSGFRTYRFLPVFWREYFPRPGHATPPWAQQLKDQLARERFGAAYDSASGIVRLPNPQRLRGPLAAIPAGREDDPDVAFFLARNPGHQRGDELVCLAELSEDNLTPAGRRMVANPLP